MKNLTTAEYFKTKASQYDMVENQPYWQLSDLLLWELLNKSMLTKFTGKFVFLDAGGGTGRWTKKILDSKPLSYAHLKDISSDMLSVAKKKLSSFPSERIVITEGDIQSMNDIDDETFDLVFSFHNVLGFVANAEAALKEQYRVLKTGGYLVTVAPSKYHMAFFNIFVRDLQMAETCLTTSKGKFTKEMPEIDNFTPKSLIHMYKRLGIEEVYAYGFPMLIYPGYQETQISGSSDAISNILTDTGYFRRVLEMEKLVIFDESAAARGNNLFVYGKK